MADSPAAPSMPVWAQIVVAVSLLLGGAGSGFGGHAAAVAGREGAGESECIRRVALVEAQQAVTAAAQNQQAVKDAVTDGRIANIEKIVERTAASVDAINGHFTPHPPRR